MKSLTKHITEKLIINKNFDSGISITNTDILGFIEFSYIGNYNSAYVNVLNKLSISKNKDDTFSISGALLSQSASLQVFQFVHKSEVSGIYFSYTKFNNKHILRVFFHKIYKNDFLRFVKKLSEKREYTIEYIFNEMGIDFPEMPISFLNKPYTINMNEAVYISIQNFLPAVK